MSTKRRLACGTMLLAVSPVSFALGSRRPPSIPSGYAAIAGRFRIPAAILYGVALQESAMLFGESQERRPLPWPWTLNIAGTPARLPSRAEAERRLQRSLLAGVDSVDVGPMGVNWRYHRVRLRSVALALDPYWNLQVGADLLREHFRTCADWTTAVGRYHAPVDKVRAAAYAAQVFARIRRLGRA